jgi:uncharacterized protein YkwD
MRTVSAMAAAAVLLALPVAAAEAETGSASETAEATMVDVINNVRARNGLDALRGSSSLAGSARRFSHWLMEHDTFGHAQTIQASSEFALLGEALEMHSGRRFKVRETVDRWMGSPSHRAIVLSKTMRWLGTGVTRGRFGARPATIWVLHVGRLKPPGADLPAPRLPLP